MSGEATHSDHTSLQVGYRNFFSSVLAYNQKGFAAGVKESGIPREELYVCGSVLSNRARGFDSALKLSEEGCAENMRAFRTGGIEYLDMVRVMKGSGGTTSCMPPGESAARAELTISTLADHA